MAELVSRLGQAAVPAGTALGILSAILMPGERVECLVAGTQGAAAAVAALTDGRLVLVNDKQWSPDITTFTITASLVVQGLQDERSASLTFIDGAERATVAQIVDRERAHEMARMVRERVAGGG